MNNRKCYVIVCSIFLFFIILFSNTITSKAANEAVVGGGEVSSGTGSLNTGDGVYGYGNNRLGFRLVYAGYGAEVYREGSRIFGKFDNNYQFWFLAGEQVWLNGVGYNAGAAAFTINGNNINPAFCGVKSSSTPAGTSQFINKAYYIWGPSYGYYNLNNTLISGGFFLETSSTYSNVYMATGYSGAMKMGTLTSNVSTNYYGIYDDLFKALIYHVNQGNLHIYKPSQIHVTEMSTILKYDKSFEDELKTLYTRYFTKWGFKDGGGYVSTYGSYNENSSRNINYWHLSKDDYNYIYNYLTSNGKNSSSLLFCSLRTL